MDPREPALACRAKPLYEHCARARSRTASRNARATCSPTATMRADQLRLWFASMAYALICALRRIGLAQTPLATATCGTIRRSFSSSARWSRSTAGEDRFRLHLSGRRMAPRRGKVRPRPRLASLTPAAAARPPATKPTAHRRKLLSSASNCLAHPAPNRAARHPQTRQDRAQRNASHHDGVRNAS
jgi:hypothetical protein